MEFKSVTLETCLLFAAVFMASIASCSRRLMSGEPFHPWKLFFDFILSWLAALMMYGLCRGFNINEWITISFVSVACFAGGNALNFAMWIMKSTAIKVVEKTANIDLDDDEGMK